MSIYDIIYSDVDRNVIAKLGKGKNSGVDSYVGSEVGSGDDEGVGWGMRWFWLCHHSK